jgi:hypothetical protein
MQDQSHLVRQGRAATGPVRCQLALVAFDQVLRLTARTLDLFIKMPGSAPFDVGDNVADIRALPRHLDPRHDPARV